MSAFQKTLSDLYNGKHKRSTLFRFGLLAFDIITIGFFIVTTTVELSKWIIVTDLVIAVVLILDFIARFVLARNRVNYLIHPISLADLIVILALLAPTFIDNLAFLRALRALRLLRSYHLLRDLRKHYKFFSRNEELIQSILNLVVFIFVVTALVFVAQVDDNPQIQTYMDALYFTVSTLTTTGFGDITLQGSTGRFLSVMIMVLGVALFLKLVRAIFRPAKVRYACPDCGLNRHDPDAVHCKHCGRILQIETEGV